jgi:predicted ferric reductase
MDKIKAFFQNKIVKAVSWIVMLIAAAILVIGGVTEGDINSSIKLVVGILGLLGELIIFIANRLKKE